jgi:7,8-dihydroneopterin aldolase/epimerase/oxygenase
MRIRQTKHSTNDYRKRQRTDQIGDNKKKYFVHERDATLGDAIECPIVVKTPAVKLVGAPPACGFVTYLSIFRIRLMDWIFIRELRLPAWIGLYKHEKVAPQTIEIDLEIALPGDAVFRTGRVKDTIDYGVVSEMLKVLLAKEKFGLVESLAEHIAQKIIEEFNAPRVNVCITKLGVLREAKRVGVRIERAKS